jgi:hypothetical protein
MVAFFLFSFFFCGLGHMLLCISLCTSRLALIFNDLRRSVPGIHPLAGPRFVCNPYSNFNGVPFLLNDIL